MAKRLIKWTLDGAILKLSKAVEGNKAVIVEAEFNLSKLFADYLTLNDVQKHIISYGAKQNLVDVGASEIAEPGGKISAAKKRWAEWLEGKVSGERVNATGAAENKRVLGLVKEEVRAVTLTGLMLKKLTFPATFTEEDETKLNEFLEVLARESGKKGKKV